jgi:hypothetical protein
VPVSVASLPLPSGAATAGKQDTGNTSLASIDGKLPATAAADRTTAAAPASVRLSDGSAFYKGTTPADTQPISASSLPLPSGAAIASKQPALGTAGTASADVITVQGISGMTAVKVDGSGVTQPVSGPLTDTQLRASAVPVSGTFFQPTQPVSIAATVAVSGPLTDTQLRASAVPVSLATLPALTAGSAVIGHVIADSGSTTAVTGNVTVTQATGTNLHAVIDSAPTTAVTNAGLSNLDVALSTRTKPADQQHTIIDSSASIAVTGPLTDTQLRATPVPVSGTVTANISGSISNTGFTANAGTNLNTSLLALESGGNLATVVTNTAAPQTTAGTSTAPTKVEVVAGVARDGTYQPLPLSAAGQAMTVTVISPAPLPSPFRCNALRRTSCQ